MSTDAALQRLAASRASINAELLKLQGFDGEAEADSPQRDPAFPDGSDAPSTPWFETASRALRLWWRHHPARPVLGMASDAGALALKPLVRTHPVVSLSLAMAVGAAMMVWRRRIITVVWAGLAARLTAGLFKSVLNPGTLMALLSSLPRPTATPPPPPTEKTPTS